MTPPSSVEDIRVGGLDPTNYGRLSVVSTESSGGGLPYFGVFSDEPICTVYLDVRQGETDSYPLWTLEFAVPGNPAVQKSPDPELDESQQREETEEDKSQDRFVLPGPVVKEPPALSLELVRRHLRQMVIVYAVINVEGKMEQMAVMESPDNLLHQPVIEALSQWIFQPGLLNDVPVPVQSLLGIPLWVSVPPG